MHVQVVAPTLLVLPVGHAVHATAPADAVYEFAEHTDLNEPMQKKNFGVQVSQTIGPSTSACARTQTLNLQEQVKEFPEPDAALPALHRQVEAPDELVLFDGQVMHDDASAKLNVPAEQTDDVNDENLSQRHKKQDLFISNYSDCSSTSRFCFIPLHGSPLTLYVPAAHAVHTRVSPLPEML